MILSGGLFPTCCVGFFVISSRRPCRIGISRNLGTTCQTGCPDTFGKPNGESESPFHLSPSRRPPPSYTPDMIEYLPLSNSTQISVHRSGLTSIAIGISLYL